MSEWLKKAAAPGFVAGMGKGVGALLILVILMMWLSGAFLDKVEPGPPAERPKPGKLEARKVERRVFPLAIDEAGTVRARNEAQVSSRIMAQVKEVLVREGDTVSGPEEAKGGPSVLARLDDREIQARLRQAEPQIQALNQAIEAARAKLGAARAQAEVGRANRVKVSADYRRYEELKRYQAATGQQLDHARATKDVADAQAQAALRDVEASQSDIKRLQAQKEQAEAAVAEAKVMLSYTLVPAPFTGKVIKKMVNVGDMAVPGQPLFLLETDSRPELHAFVSESFLPSLRIGETLRIHIDALNRDFEGKVREITPKSDPATRTVLVKADLPADPSLVNGLFGRLELPYGRYDALVIPQAAVREVGQLQLVDVLDAEGYPQRRFVTLGPRHGQEVEVLSGLRENEEVVVP